jgi:uncharacterized damage-inducible protein DinB
MTNIPMLTLGALHPRELFRADFLRLAREVRSFLRKAPQEIMEAPRLLHRMFTVPEVVCHLCKVNDFALRTVAHQVMGEDDGGTSEDLHYLTEMTTEEAHLAFSVINFHAARRAAEPIRTIQALRRHWDEGVKVVLKEVGAFDDQAWRAPVTHPFIHGVGGNTLDFLRVMLVDHGYHHLGQMNLLSRLLGFEVPSPLGEREITGPVFGSVKDRDDEPCVGASIYGPHPTPATGGHPKGRITPDQMGDVAAALVELDRAINPGSADQDPAPEERSDFTRSFAGLPS